MTNTQLYIAVGVPFFTLLIIWLANTRSIDALRSEMREGFARVETRLSTMDARLTSIDSAMRGIYEVVGRHEEAIDTLKKRTG